MHVFPASDKEEIRGSFQPRNLQKKINGKPYTNEGENGFAYATHGDVLWCHVSGYPY